MANFNTNNKVLSNLDVKLNKLGGYLYVNEQGNIEVKDIKPNIINIWEGCAYLTSPIDITNYINVNSDTHINLLISGYYINASFGRALCSYMSNNVRDFKGVPSFFGVETSYYGSMSKPHVNIVENSFSEYNFVENCNRLESVEPADVVASMIANESFCNLISITIPANINNEYSSSCITEDNGNSILTGLEIFKNRDFYYYTSYSRGNVVKVANYNLHYLNSLLKIQSGRAKLTIGITNRYLGEEYKYNSNIIHPSWIRPNPEGYYMQNLRLTSVSIIKESKIN